MGEQKISPNSDFLKLTFTDSDYIRPNYFRLRLRRPGSGSSVWNSHKIYWNNTFTSYKKDIRNTEIVEVYYQSTAGAML